MGENDDPTDPVLYTDEEVADQTMLGLRPDHKHIINTFWADDGKSLWVRSTRTWTLPALIHIYGHRYSFKYLWIAWNQMPVTIQSHRRGKDAPNSETALRLVKWKEIKQQADSFMKAAGLDAPSTHDEWVALFKEMGKFMATKAFMTRTPTPVMELPIAPLHDSKEALRFRAICDERITLPLSAFAEQPAIHEALTKELPLDAMADIKVNWRCNTEHWWAQEVTPEAAVPFYRKMKHTDEEIRELGCPPGPMPSGDPSTKELVPDQPTLQFPPLTLANVASVASKEYIKKHFAKGKHVFWGKVECGLILPSLSSWEVVTKQKGVTTGGYMCKYCKGFWKGGSRFLQIIGRHKSKVAALQLVLDEPPQELHNRWIKDRMEFYKRVEPLAAPRDERLDLVGGPQNRLRFSTSNGLGVVSDALWTTILGNEEVSSLKMIHQVAMQHGRK